MDNSNNSLFNITVASPKKTALKIGGLILWVLVNIAFLWYCSGKTNPMSEYEILDGITGGNMNVYLPPEIEEGIPGSTMVDESEIVEILKDKKFDKAIKSITKSNPNAKIFGHSTVTTKAPVKCPEIEKGIIEIIPFAVDNRLNLHHSVSVLYKDGTLESLPIESGEFVYTIPPVKPRPKTILDFVTGGLEIDMLYLKEYPDDKFLRIRPRAGIKLGERLNTKFEIYLEYDTLTDGAGIGARISANFN